MLASAGFTGIAGATRGTRTFVMVLRGALGQTEFFMQTHEARAIIMHRRVAY